MTDRAWTVSPEDADTRLDTLLARLCPDLTRSQAQLLLAQGAVTADGEIAKKNDKLAPGVQLHITLPEPTALHVRAEDIPLAIVYEDDDLLVVNKPKGMVVHPGAGNPTGTLVNALLAHCGDSLSGINGVLRPGIVHRIDKDTAGLLLVAKNDFAHRALAAQLEAHSLERVYRAVCVGTFRAAEGTVDLPIGRHPKERLKFAVTDKSARRAVTHYRVLEAFHMAGYGAYSLLELRLETGRTHQIRVHMAHLGRPVAGDTLYRSGKMPATEIALGGQCLFAAVLGFVHPRTGDFCRFEADLPDWFSTFLDARY